MWLAFIKIKEFKIIKSLLNLQVKLNSSNYLQKLESLGKTNLNLKGLYCRDEKAVKYIGLSHICNMSIIYLIISN